MIDPKLLRNTKRLSQYKDVLAEKGMPWNVLIDISAYQTEKIKAAKDHEKLLQQSNTLSDSIRTETDTSAKLQLILRSQELKRDIQDSKQRLRDLYKDPHLTVPNIPLDSVPRGLTDQDNVVVKTWGTPRLFDFEIKDHNELATSLGLDLQCGTKLSGSRFPVMVGTLAKLQRQLKNLMLDFHTTHHGYTEVFVPAIVKSDTMQNTGQLPKFKDDLYQIKDDDLFLIPTAEVPVTNIHQHSVLPVSELPIKYTAHTSCFRREAGTYGKDSNGLIRNHQFEKVELVQIVDPDDSESALNDIVEHAEAILQVLDLPYRVIELCTGDLGFSSAKTYDIEVWIPSLGEYKEISSCSNMTDFQTRRMKTKVKREDGSKVLAHSLNGSGLAIGRTIVALLENHQMVDGTIDLPQILSKY